MHPWTIAIVGAVALSLAGASPGIARPKVSSAPPPEAAPVFWPHASANLIEYIYYHSPQTMTVGSSPTWSANGLRHRTIRSTYCLPAPRAGILSAAKEAETLEIDAGQFWRILSGRGRGDNLLEHSFGL